MSRTQRRHKVGFGYIGFGNDQNIFNRKASKPFSQVKNKLNAESLSTFNTSFDNHKLSAFERKQIKLKIRSKQRKKNTISLITTIIIMIPIVYFFINTLTH